MKYLKPFSTLAVGIVIGMYVMPRVVGAVKG